MNGQMIPAIIFTDCDHVPQDVERGHSGKVIYLPEVKAPSADMTLRWLEEVREYLEDEPLIVHDKGPEYIAKSLKEELEMLGIEEMEIPSAGGAFINPCDNSFNSQLKTAYFQERKKTYEDKLRAILTAYYSPEEEVMKSYFERVGWTGDRLSKKQVQNLLDEGYRPGKKHAKLYEDMNAVYDGWKRNLRTATLETRTTFPHKQPVHTWYAWD